MRLQAICFAPGSVATDDDGGVFLEGHESYRTYRSYGRLSGALRAVCGANVVRAPREGAVGFW